MSRNDVGALKGSSKQDAQELADQAMLASRKGEAAALARKALDLDGECTDAQIVLAREEAESPKDLAARLKIIVARAEAKLGTPFLQDHRGNLWELPEARPYLRSLMALAAALEKCGKPSLAILHLEELLKSDRHDHLGARYRMVCCLLAANQLKPLAECIKDWEKESPVFMAWAAVLERIRAKSEKGAEKVLAHARQMNPHFEEFLTGKRRLPKQIPSAVKPGSPEEAATVLRSFGETWTNDREAMYWLFRHS